MKIDENKYYILKNAIDITLVNYDIKWFDAENIDGYIDSEELLSIIQDLVVEYHKKEEELEELKEHCKEHHQEKKIDYYDEYGISERDFH